MLLGRTARGRVLYVFSGEYHGRDRPRSYGERVRKPSEWLLVQAGWITSAVKVRGRMREMRYLVSAVKQGSHWQLPLPIQELLTWAWQR